MSSTAARAGTQTQSRDEGWTNHIPRSFVRSRTSPRLKEFLTVVDDLGVVLPWGPGHAWGVQPSNTELREILGRRRKDGTWQPCSDDTIGRLWEQAEAEGFLIRDTIVSVTGRVVGRRGYVWLRRPTDGPVATTAAEIAAAKAQLRAAIEGQRGRPRTIPYPTDRPSTYRKTADAPTADLRMHLPQNCGRCAPAPIEEPARPETPGETPAENQTTTTASPGSEASPVIHACESESSSSPASIPLRPEGRAIPDPEAPDAARPIEAVDPAGIAAMEARARALFGLDETQARGKVATAIVQGRRIAMAGGFCFEPGWVGTAMDEAERLKAAGKVKNWGWGLVLGIAGNYAREGGPDAREGPRRPGVDARLKEYRSRCPSGQGQGDVTGDYARESTAGFAEYWATRRPSP
jgi:hypothetical protein